MIISVNLQFTHFSLNKRILGRLWIKKKDSICGKTEKLVYQGKRKNWFFRGNNEI